MAKEPQPAPGSKVSCTKCKGIGNIRRLFSIRSITCPLCLGKGYGIQRYFPNAETSLWKNGWVEYESQRIIT